LCQVDKPYFFLLKSDQLIYTCIPVRRYAGTSIENGTSLNSVLKKHALKTHLTCFKVPIGMYVQSGMTTRLAGHDQIVKQTCQLTQKHALNAIWHVFDLFLKLS